MWWMWEATPTRQQYSLFSARHTHHLNSSNVYYRERSAGTTFDLTCNNAEWRLALNKGGECTALA